MSKKEICKYAIISQVDNSKLAYIFKVEGAKPIMLKCGGSKYVANNKIFIILN